ncbi:MAG: glutaredoxin 3 [Pseudomonadota bacterium]
MSDEARGVVMYSTGWCPYCMAARDLLQRKGVAYEEIDVMDAPEQRREMRERSGRTSVPQVFIGERHIGGYDDLSALERAGELDTLLGTVGNDKDQGL